MRGGWRRFDVAAFGLPCLALKLMLVAYFVFAIVYLGLRYAVMPQIDEYRGEVERVATRAIGRPVTIGAISASWQGLRPQLQLGQVAIYGRDGQPALQLPHVSAVVSWWSLPVFDLRLHRLDIDRPEMDIERDAQGRFHIGGMPLDTEQEGNGRGADWVLSQRDIHINSGRLRWKDALRQAPELVLERVNMVLQSRGRHHHFGLQAVPPTAIAAPLDVRARFEHPRFAERISNPALWTGEIYADLRDTDLAAWKTYLDFPFDLQTASGSLRTWLSFDHARVANLTADLALSDVLVQLRKDLPPLDLVSAQGRVSIQETIDDSVRDGTPTFGLRGHAVAVRNFTLQTRDGLVLPTTTVSERFVAARNGAPERTEVQAQMLDLQALAAFAERLPLPATQLQLIRDFAPRGQLKDFSAQWQGAYPDVQSYSVKGDFNGLSLRDQPARPARKASAGSPAQAAVPAIPGFENLSGHIDAGDQGGSILLASRDVSVASPAYLADPVLEFDTLDVDAKWRFEKNDMLLMTVRRMAFAKDSLRVALEGSHLMPLDRRERPGTGVIDLKGTIDGLPLQQVGSYLPLGLHQDVREWLDGALAGGMLRDATLRVKGDLARFPFHKEGAGAKDKSEFTFAGRIEDGVLNYSPTLHARDGKSPLWPLLEKIQGSILFDKTRLEVHGKSGETHGTQVADVKAVVPDLLSKESVLHIDGTASGPLQNFLRYTVDSPVGEWIGHFTDEAKGSGNAALSLKLALPLHHMREAKVNGALKFANNGVTLMNVMPEIAQTSGRLEFDEKGVMLRDIKGSFLGGPLTLSGGSQKDGTIQVRAEGTLTAAGLRKAYPAQNLQKVMDRVSGSTRYSATVGVRGKSVDVAVDSNLRGLGLDFPSPLQKNARDPLPLRYVQSGVPSDDAAVLRDTVRISLGSTIASLYQRERSSEPGASWRVVRGGIGINAPLPPSGAGLQSNISVAALDIDAWIAAIGGALTRGQTDTAQNAPGLAQYLEPDKLAVRADEMTVLGKRFDDVTLGLTRGDEMWQANIESVQAHGHLAWNEPRGGRGLGRVTARLKSLVVQKTASGEVDTMLDKVDDDATELPALDIVADSFELYGKKLGRLELLAHYVRATEGREWRIRNLALSNPDADFKATGNWIARNGGNASHLDYQMDIRDSGKLLARFGFADVLRAGAGSMSGDISWRGLPFAIDYPSLSGNINLDVKKGQFLKVEPGAAKLLGVLSMQSLPRRLTLDFRDVFSEGFAFDGINGSARITDGVAQTGNLKMRGVSATVLIDGVADIVHETQDLRAVVIPEINAGAASVAYALAVNPVIGAGTLLAQLFLRQPLARAFTYEYAITGGWSDPNVSKIERKVETDTPPNSRLSQSLYEG
ncbi:DUF3971 domain-containing protein [Oxalicibacterium flavum]|uniref:DUF3971 domain-containing protein n=1 Tax=Oxalicibacterium flavum TaxID=179467 RepID=A0A8J2XXF0_9BURK|nr:DUF3971 domain-containing protein [Oxalicibacterium flavum]